LILSALNFIQRIEDLALCRLPHKRRAGSKSALPHHQWRLAMELLLVIIVVVLLFGGGGYWGRRQGHW
jgi:hypothetical protein